MNNPKPPTGEPIPFAKTTSWSTSHVGRAFAINAAFGTTSVVLKDGTLDPNQGTPEDVYGSDLLAHLGHLAAKEAKR